MSLLPIDWVHQDPAVLACLAPIHHVEWPAFAAAGVSVSVKREDLLDPYLGGNKLYKMHGHIRAALAVGARHLVSFGGAWSNHLYALAAAGKRLGLRTTAVVRGEMPAQLTPTLADAKAMGMQLLFVSRSDYRRKQETPFLERLQRQLGEFHLIPEGGGDAIGADGAAALGRGLNQLHQQHPFDIVCCAVGTGATLAGLRMGLPQNVSVCGFSVLKEGPRDRGDNSLYYAVEQLLRNSDAAGRPWQLETGYHTGGYARVTDELAQFMLKFEQATGVMLDPVYTAKLMWGIHCKAVQGQWQRGTRLLIVHSGGLQGRRGFPNVLADEA